MENPDWNAMNPVRMWRDWMVKSEAQWSDAVSQILKSEHSGSTLNQQLSEVQILHRQFSEFAQTALAAANMPSRSDFEALDERMGRLEDGLANLSAAVSRLTQTLAAAPATSPAIAAKKPSRTRRAAKTVVKPTSNAKG